MNIIILVYSEIPDDQQIAIYSYSLNKYSQLLVANGFPTYTWIEFAACSGTVAIFIDINQSEIVELKIHNGVSLETY